MDTSNTQKNQPSTTHPTLNVDIKSGSLNFLRAHAVWWVVLFAGVVLATVAGILLQLQYLGAYFILPLFMGIIWFAYIQQRSQNDFYAQFALANNFVFRQRGFPVGLDGALFKIGHSPRVFDAVLGMFSSLPMRLFTCSYTVGSGKESHTYTATVLEFQITNATVPDMLLEGRQHFFGASLFEKWKNDERTPVHLEGDFDQYFSLSVAKGYEIEALQMFTPEVMQSFIDHFTGFSIELINKHLFIYSTKTIRTGQELGVFYDCATYCIQQLLPELSLMKSSLAAMEEVEPTE